ncbi:hypothetical protein ACFX2I_014921 [Malus domestica]
MSVKKTLKTSSVPREGPPSAERPVIDMISSNGKKNEVVRSEHVAPAMSRMASTTADRIAQRKGPVMPPVPKSVPRCPLGAKFDSHLERLAIMKSDKVDSTAKMVPKPTPPAAETDSPVGKEETARVGSCEKSTKLASGEVAEIYAFFKPHLFEDMHACAKFFDGVRGVVYPSFFTKHTTKYKKTALLAMMQKMTIQATESMLLDQQDTKAARWQGLWQPKLIEKIKMLESKLVALKGSNISAPISL